MNQARIQIAGSTLALGHKSNPTSFKMILYFANPQQIPRTNHWFQSHSTQLSLIDSRKMKENSWLSRFLCLLSDLGDLVLDLDLLLLRSLDRDLDLDLLLPLSRRRRLSRDEDRDLDLDLDLLLFLEPSLLLLRALHSRHHDEDGTFKVLILS